MSNLVIMESPNKIAPVKKYLGANYKVIASVGHVRDLPKSTLGVDIENDFEPHYINIRGKGDLIKEIKKEAKNSEKVFAYLWCDASLGHHTVATPACGWLDVCWCNALLWHHTVARKITL